MSAAQSHNIPFSEAVKVWARVAALSFGGPAGQIAVMHRILVEEKKWIGEERFLHALNYCMLLPGPEAQQLATYIGWLLHKTKGGIVAGALFVLPGFVAIMVLSWLYALYGNLGPIEAMFVGLKAAVLAVVFQAVRRIGGKALKNRAMGLIAAAAFVAIFFFAIPFPFIIIAAAAIGFFGGKTRLAAFQAGGGHEIPGETPVADRDTALGEHIPDHARPSLGWSLRISAVLLFLWLAPVAALVMAMPDSVYADIATFFSKMAVVTFGGAYAVLAYVAQEAVENYGWLRPGEMLDGLGMAETTPGPLIMVTQFVGFLGAAREPGGLDPLMAGTLAAVLTTWVTFVPCFLWIFLGAPFAETMRGNTALSSAMTAITAAVVGVVLNLAVWFSLHTMFAEVVDVRAGPLRLDMPILESVNLSALLLTLAALVAVFRFRLGPMAVVGGGAAAGLLFWLL
ncbi:MAG TPA: chromate efflux transporter [Sphingomicrobium sp.]|nr:chromate efflux transporter [Sphingomicrobium sp.]